MLGERFTDTTFKLNCEQISPLKFVSWRVVVLVSFHKCLLLIAIMFNRGYY